MPVVDAHNTIYTYGRTGLIHLPRMELSCTDYAECTTGSHERCDMPPMRVVVTDTGRVGKDVVRVLKDDAADGSVPGNLFLKDTGDSISCFYRVLLREHPPSAGRMAETHSPGRISDAPPAGISNRYSGPMPFEADIFISMPFSGRAEAPVFLAAEANGRAGIRDPHHRRCLP